MNGTAMRAPEADAPRHDGGTRSPARQTTENGAAFTPVNVRRPGPSHGIGSAKTGDDQPGFQHRTAAGTLLASLSKTQAFTRFYAISSAARPLLGLVMMFVVSCDSCGGFSAVRVDEGDASDTGEGADASRDAARNADALIGASDGAATSDGFVTDSSVDVGAADGDGVADQGTVAADASELDGGADASPADASADGGASCTSVSWCWYDLTATCSDPSSRSTWSGPPTWFCAPFPIHVYVPAGDRSAPINIAWCMIPASTQTDIYCFLNYDRYIDDARFFAELCEIQTVARDASIMCEWLE